MAIVHVIIFVEDERTFSSVGFLKSKLRNNLDEYIQVEMYSQRIYSLENFSYQAMFDEWFVSSGRGRYLMGNWCVGWNNSTSKLVGSSMLLVRFSRWRLAYLDHFTLLYEITCLASWMLFVAWIFSYWCLQVANISDHQWTSYLPLHSSYHELLCFILCLDIFWLWHRSAGGGGAYECGICGLFYMPSLCKFQCMFSNSLTWASKGGWV